MNHAVIQSGNKQYLVTDGSTIKVDKLIDDAGKKITFAEVLLTATDAAVSVGTPFVKGAKVEATVVRHGRHAKVTGVKMKPKKRRKKLFGHKQHFTELQITKVTAK